MSLEPLSEALIHSKEGGFRIWPVGSFLELKCSFFLTLDGPVTVVYRGSL